MSDTPAEKLLYAIEDLRCYRDGLEMACLHDAADRIAAIARSLEIVHAALAKRKPVRKKPLKLIVNNQ